MTDLSLPDFLNRRITPVSVATLEERRAAFPQVAAIIDAVELQRELDAKLEDDEKKERARARIGKMKARFAQNSQLAVGKNAIPEKYLGWDGRRQTFFDHREKWAKKLSKALTEAGLEHLINVEMWKQHSPDALIKGYIFQKQEVSDDAD